MNMPPQETPSAPLKKRRAEAILSVEAIISFALVIVLLFGLSAVVRSVLRSGGMAAVISASLVELANFDRAEGHLGTLTINPVLVAAAQAKANDMAAKGYFAHVSPDGSDSWTWFKKAGYSFSYAGENLAVNFSDSDEVEQAWMESPTHRANILNGRFTEIGIATAVGTYKGRTTTFVVQMFGTPSAFQKTAPIRTISGIASSTQTAVATTVAGSSTSAVLGASTPPEEVTPSAGAVIAPAAPAHTLTLVDRLLASPRSLLREVYIGCAILLLLVLGFATGLEFKKHHLRHVAAAACLIVLMLGLSVAADYLIFTKPILGSAQVQEAG